MMASLQKVGGKYLVRRLRDLFVIIWKTGNVPQAFKDASIIHLYKNKGAKNVCDNQRGILYSRLQVKYFLESF